MIDYFLLLSNVSSHCSKIGLLGKNLQNSILTVVEFIKDKLEMLENADEKLN